jgi:NADH-quinone oxidoreductase subunit D
VDVGVSGLRHVRAGVGPGALADADLVLDLGPAHPTTHGGLQLALDLDGDVVVRAEPVVGFMHRGAEKLFEVRDYRQALVLANRHDWLSAFGNELGLALAVERMLGTVVPPRAVWLRTLMAELNRVAASLLFVGGGRLDGDPTAVHGHPERERVLRVLEEATGGRVHFMANQVGGLKAEVPAGWTERVRHTVDHVREELPRLDALVDGAAERLRGVGVLPADVVLAHGASGPVARASGVDLDLRRDDPYLAYADLGFGGDALPVVLGASGDTADRYACLLRQVHVSLDVVEACLDTLPSGAVNVRLPKTVRAPEGTTYAWTENPLGAQGYYLHSRGASTPYRLAMRTASFGNASVLPALLPGVHLRDVATVLGSLFLVVGDLDK